MRTSSDNLDIEAQMQKSGNMGTLREKAEDGFPSKLPSMGDASAASSRFDSYRQPNLEKKIKVLKRFVETAEEHIEKEHS